MGTLGSRRFLERIWHVSGSLALQPGQSADDAFDRLDPLFRQTGTSHERASNTLTFQKKQQAAQDPMAVFDSGVLQIEPGETGGVLRYRLNSRALLLCFLAPLLFLGFAQLTITVNTIEKAAAEAAGKSGKKPDAAKQADKKAEMPMHPIDKALGAPAPKKPDDKADGGKKKPTPTPAYVFAAIFAVLYGIGRILEARLVKALFQKKLAGA